MIVTETTPVAQSALPVARLKEHLRLASGFAEDQIQDALLAGFLRAALTAIETRTSKALIRRAFTITLNDWAPRTRLGVYAWSPFLARADYTFALGRAADSGDRMGLPCW